MNDSLLSASQSGGNGSVIWMFFANPLDLRFLLCSGSSSGEGRGVRVRVRGLGDTSSPEPQNQRVYRGIDNLIWLLHPNRASFGGGGKHVKIIASFYFSISFLKISCKVAFLKKDIYIYIIYEHIYRLNLTLVITPKLLLPKFMSCFYQVFHWLSIQFRILFISHAIPKFVYHCGWLGVFTFLWKFLAKVESQVQAW